MGPGIRVAIVAAVLLVDAVVPRAADVSIAFTDAIEIMVSTPGATSSAARSRAGVTGWWAWTRSPSPFQCRSASSRMPVLSVVTGAA